MSPDNSTIWGCALEVSAAIVTKDEDFVQRRMRSTQGPAVVWVRLPNTQKRELLMWFETITPHVLRALARGQTLVEVT